MQLTLTNEVSSCNLPVYTGFMLGNTYDSEVCSAARALEVVGERWSLLIVRNALFARMTRFNDFRKRLGIATNILKTRLDSLVDAGVMQRRRYSQNPDLYEYLLTDKGRELVPVILALTEWGDRYLAPDGPPILYSHTVCGGDISLHTECATCGQLHDLSQVQALPGPGMPADRVTRFG
jgi:DNA-binding HxlR family transcriptional regulator